MRINGHTSSLYVIFGHIVVLALLLMSGHRATADSAISESISSPDSASSPLSPSSLSSSSRQKRAPGWADKRNGLEIDDDVELDGDAVSSSWDDNDSTDKRAPGWGKRAPSWHHKGKRAPGWLRTDKRAPGWGKRAPSWGEAGKRAPGWGKRAPGWGKRAPGWGKRAPGWGKRSLDDGSFLEEEENNEKMVRLSGQGKRAPGWGKRAPGWGKRAPGWGKRAPGWGKRAPGWGKRAMTDVCQELEDLYESYSQKAIEVDQRFLEFCGNSEEANEAGRK